MLKAPSVTIFKRKQIQKMQTKKMSLANIQGKLSRSEMKNIMAGSSSCSLETSCSLYTGTTWYGECGVINGHCKCITAYGDYQPTSNGGVSRCGC